MVHAPRIEKKVVVSSYTQPSKHGNLKIELEVSKEISQRKNLSQKGYTKKLPKKEIIYQKE